MLAAALHLGLAGGPHRGQRHRVDRGAGIFGAVGGHRHGAPQDRFQPVMAGMVQMIGLGGGEQDAVDPRPEQMAEEGAAADPKAIQDAGKRGFEIVQRFRPGVEGGEAPALPHIRLDRALQFLIGDRLQ